MTTSKILLTAQATDPLHAVLTIAAVAAYVGLKIYGFPIDGVLDAVSFLAGISGGMHLAQYATVSDGTKPAGTSTQGVGPQADGP